MFPFRLYPSVMKEQLASLFPFPYPSVVSIYTHKGRMEIRVDWEYGCSAELEKNIAYGDAVSE